MAKEQSKKQKVRKDNALQKIRTARNRDKRIAKELAKQKKKNTRYFQGKIPLRGTVRALARRLKFGNTSSLLRYFI
jgi:hypothetical protein